MSRRPSHKAWPGSWHPALPALTGTARPGSRPPPRPDRPSSSVVTRHAPYGIRRPVHAYDISRFRGDGVISHSKYPHCHGNMLRRDYFSRRNGRPFVQGPPHATGSHLGHPPLFVFQTASVHHPRPTPLHGCPRHTHPDCPRPSVFAELCMPHPSLPMRSSAFSVASGLTLHQHSTIHCFSRGHVSATRTANGP